MHYRDISKPLRIFLGYWEGFRKLGFRSENIYFHITENPTKRMEKWVFCTLKAQGKNLAIECAKLEGDSHKAMDEYQLISTMANDNKLDSRILDRIWQESKAFKQKERFLMLIHNMGFIFPNAHSAYQN